MDDIIFTPGRYTLGAGFYNVIDCGVVGNGSTDNTAALLALVAAAPAGSCLFFPLGHYNISGTIACGTKGLSFLGVSQGDGANGGGSSSCSMLYGSVAGPLISWTYPAMSPSVERMGLWNSDVSVGRCISCSGFGASFRDLGINAVQGIYILGGFTTNIANVLCRAGNQAGSLAVYSRNHTTIRDIDIAGYDRGIVSGGLTNIHGGRIERTGTGIYLGRTETDLDAIHSGVVEGVSVEACDLGIYVAHANSAVIQSCGVLGGSTPGPSGPAQYGIRVLFADAVDVIASGAGGTASGAFTVTGIDVSNTVGKMSFHDCISSSVGGPAWTVAGGSTAQFNNCNYP